LGDTAQRNCMMFETFLDNLMISPSRVKSSSNIWPLKMKWILCFETLALIDQRGGAISQKKGTSEEIFCPTLCSPCVYINCQVFVFQWVSCHTSVSLCAALKTLTFPCVSLYVSSCVCQKYSVILLCATVLGPVFLRVPLCTVSCLYMVVCMLSWFYVYVVLIFLYVCRSSYFSVLCLCSYIPVCMYYLQFLFVCKYLLVLLLVL